MKLNTKTTHLQARHYSINGAGFFLNEILHINNKIKTAPELLDLLKPNRLQNAQLD